MKIRRQTNGIASMIASVAKRVEGAIERGLTCTQ